MAGAAVRVSVADGTGFDARLAAPAAGSGPGVVLLHDAGGAASLAADLSAAADLYAAPDLYAAEGYAVLSAPGNLGDAEVAAAVAALRARRECTGKVAALGFGRGGEAALRAAAEQRVEAAVAYDPAGATMTRDLAAQIACPIALHFAAHDPARPTNAISRAKEALAGRSEAAIHVYPGTARGFEAKGGANYDRAGAGLAHSRSIALLRRVMGPDYDLEQLWEAHIRYEFETRDVDATMATMVPDPYVNHIPVMTGGVGARDLARFYANHFIPKCPKDIAMVPISRTIGADRIVDEMLTSFTHDVEIDWMLPGVPPTGRRVEVPIVAIVGFRGDKLYHEHIYWDQASVLVQIGLIDPANLPVAGAEAAKKLADETLPSNTLMKRWAESAPKEN